MSTNGTHAFTPEDLRRLIDEAERIAAKRTLMMPTSDHLRAVLQSRDVLASTAAETMNIVALQNRALIIAMLTLRTGHMEVKAEAIAHAEQQGLDLAISRKQKDGPIEVRMIRPASEPATKQ